MSSRLVHVIHSTREVFGLKLNKSFNIKFSSISTVLASSISTCNGNLEMVLRTVFKDSESEVYA